MVEKTVVSPSDLSPSEYSSDNPSQDWNRFQASMRQILSVPKDETVNKSKKTKNGKDTERCDNSNE